MDKVVSDRNDTLVHNVVNPVHQFPDVKVFYTSDKIPSSPHFDKPPPHPSTVKSSKLISTSCKGFNDNSNKYDKPPPNYHVKEDHVRLSHKYSNNFGGKQDSGDTGEQQNNNKNNDYYGPGGHDDCNKLDREPHHNCWGDQGDSRHRNCDGYRGRGRGGYNCNYGYDRHNWRHNDDRSHTSSRSKNIPVSSCVVPEKITEVVKKSAPSSSSSKSSSWVSNSSKNLHGPLALQQKHLCGLLVLLNHLL